MKLSREAIGWLKLAAENGKSQDIQKAFDRALEEINAKKNWHEATGMWIASSDGYFNIKDCYKELGAFTTRDMDAVRKAISRYRSSMPS